MTRRLAYRCGKNYMGEFMENPQEGWVPNRRGIRRKLCSIESINHLNTDKRKDQLIIRYSMVERAIRDEQKKAANQQRYDRTAKRNLTIKQASENWLAEVRVVNAPRTAKGYATTIKYYLEGIENHKLRDFDRTHNIRFLEYLGTCIYQGRSMTDSTKSRHIRQFGVFLRWAYDHEMIDRIWHLRKPTVPKKDMETYSVEELSSLGEHIQFELAKAIVDEDDRMTMHMRNMFRAYMLATQSLLRLGAIWSLRLERINMAKRTIRIQDNPDLGWVNKKNKWPLKPINNKLQAFLKEDLANRDPREEYYLDNGRGYPWYADRADISRWATRMCKDIGLAHIKPFHHGMRATMITALLCNGVDPVKVQQLADHDDINTTMLYKDSRRISQEDAANALADLI